MSNTVTSKDTTLNNESIESTNNNVNNEQNTNASNNEQNTNQETLNKHNLVKIRYAFRRIIRKENDIRIIQFHINNETVPKMLYPENWPTPLLPHDENYINEYNDCIFKYAIELCNMNIKALNKGIELLRSNINKYKSNITISINDIK